MPRLRDGLLVIDKPLGVTSRAVVDRVQGWLPRGVRIGHTGTLDPLATGVLVLCIGKATRLTEYVQAMRKTYRTHVQFGAISATDDAEGPITPVDNPTRPDFDTVAHAVGEFIGDIEQLPPAFSAAKVAGQRAYKLARKGSDVDLAPRRVRIDAIRILSCTYPALELEIDCGKGTYIRSLARDLGKRLGCGGYVGALRRNCVGVFTVEHAVPLDSEPQDVRLLPLEMALSDLPRVMLDADNARRLSQGQEVSYTDAGGEVAVFADPLGLVGVARAEGGCLRPHKILRSHSLSDDWKGEKGE